MLPQCNYIALVMLFLAASLPQTCTAESERDTQEAISHTADASIVLELQRAGSELKLLPLTTGDRARIGLEICNGMDFDTRFSYSNSCPCLQPDVPFLDIPAGKTMKSYVDFVVPYSTGPFLETIRANWNGPDGKPRKYVVTVTGFTYDLLAPSDGSGVEDFGAEPSRIMNAGEIIGQFEIRRDPLATSWDSVRAVVETELFTVRTVAKQGVVGAWTVEIRANEKVIGTMLVGHFVVPVRFEFSNGGTILKRHVDRTAAIYYRNREMLPNTFVDFGDLSMGDESSKSLHLGEGVQVESIDFSVPDFADYHIESAHYGQTIILKLRTDQSNWLRLTGRKSGEVVIRGKVGVDRVLLRVPLVWRCKSSN